jgi:hypothetical protein
MPTHLDGRSTLELRRSFSQRRGGAAGYKKLVQPSSFLCEPRASARSFFISPDLTIPPRRCEISRHEDCRIRNDEGDI